MTTLPAHNQLSLLPTPADTVIRCKTCKSPLTDSIWKNCASCRRNRTESYNRWKKSAQLRSTRKMDLIQLNSSTLLQPPGPTAPLDHHSNEPSHYGDPSGSSRLANDQPQRTSTSTVPQPAEAIEYQWSDELIEALLTLPPRSRYIGMFSIIADPAVNNSTRAHLFADQLHARVVPISDHSRPISLNAGSSNSCGFRSHCTCQEGCQGWFDVYVDDDPSHPYGVPGQRIGVIVMH